MQKARGPIWWYDLRYGGTWPIALAIAGIGIFLAVAVAAGVPEWIAERKKASAAACVAHGGHIVFANVKGRVPVCEGL